MTCRCLPFLNLPLMITAMDAGEDWKRLGEYVLARRTALGFRSHAAFEGATGLGARTLGDIERGHRKSYSPATLARLDAALGWTIGSSRRVLLGQEPSVPPAVVVTEMPSPEPGVTVHIAELADELEKVSPEDREEAVRIVVDLFRVITGKKKGR